MGKDYYLIVIVLVLLGITYFICMILLTSMRGLHAKKLFSLYRYSLGIMASINNRHSEGIIMIINLAIWFLWGKT